MRTNNHSPFGKKTAPLLVAAAFFILAASAAVFALQAHAVRNPNTGCNGYQAYNNGQPCQPNGGPAGAASSSVTCTDGSTQCGYVTYYDPGKYSQSQCSLYWDATGKSPGGERCDAAGNLDFVGSYQPAWYASGVQGYVPNSDVYNDPAVNIGFFSGMPATVNAFYTNGGSFSVGSGANSMSGNINACTCWDNWDQESGQNCRAEPITNQTGTVNPGAAINMYDLNECAAHGSDIGQQWGYGQVNLLLNSVTECYSSLTTSGTSTYDYPPYVQHGVNYVPAAPGVCSPATTTATITVTSENAVSSSVPVAASWTFSQYPSSTASSSGNPCGSGACSGSYQLYANLPLGTYGIGTSTPEDASRYAFNAVQAPAVAEKPPGDIFADFFSRIVRTAEAELTCGFVNTGTSTCPGRLTLDLKNSGDTGNFVLLWDPIAQIEAPSSYTMPNGYYGAPTGGAIKVKNDGGTGSTLVLTASSSEPWLTINALYGTSSIVAPGSQDIIVGASSSLPVGKHTAAITWKGVSQPGSRSILSPGEPYPTTTVTLTILPPPPSCNFGANPTSVSPGASSTLSWGCQYATSCTLDGGQFGSGQTESVPSGNVSVTPSGTTDYGLSCTGPNGTYQSTTTVTVSGPQSSPGPGGLREINP